MEYVNLKLAKINQDITFSSLCNHPPKLTICSENDDWQEIFNFSEKQYVNCLSKNFSFNINETLNRMKCFKKNPDYLYNPCQICGNNYFEKREIIDNITYINCYEYKEGYYFDDEILEYKLCYFSCKSCNMSGNESEHNCIECNENHGIEFNLSIYKNCFMDIHTDLETNIRTKDTSEIKNETELMQIMIKNLFSQLNISNIDNGIDNKIYEKNISMILTSTKNQKNNENEKMITIDLCRCDNILKEEYNISENDPLYILQIIYEEEGMKIPKIEYEVYYPFYNNNLTKLNLTVCKGTKIEISIPVKLNDDNIDKYNPKSGYYNDICYKTTSESGTDISLKDRQNEFVENNMTLCEENCDLINYNYTSEKAKCSCDIKTNINPNCDFKFNKKEFFKSFTYIKNIANINIIKCYKIVLNVKNLVNNYGFYIMAFIMFLYFMTNIIFWFISYKKLMKYMFNLPIILNNIESLDVQPKAEKKNNPIKKKIKKTKKIRISKKKKNNNENNFNIHSINEKISLRNNNNRIEHIYNKQKDFEINSLEYEEAIRLDKRNYFQYYLSLLKYNHPLLFSFGTYNDYNSRIIKIFLFFFSLSSDLTINALFFNDNTMHKVYRDKGKYNLLFQIPQILYSTLISRVIDTLIKYFALFQDSIVELKQEKGKNNIKKKYARILNIIKIKIILFFVLAFIILLFFWYYIACFCGIYVNTQIHLIKDSVISLIVSLIFPFIINLIPGIFRISALKIEKSSGKYLYKFSFFLENYLL